jgi:hypothetical protein
MSDGRSTAIPLEPQPVAELYQRLMGALDRLGVRVAINTRPQEVPDPIPFEQDYQHRAYDREYVVRFWRALMSSAAVLGEFRGRFLGKSSPVHFFWGSADLAATRFSGRRAPPRKGVISSEAYSHECISAGFWPGLGFGKPAFYSYTVPEPPGLRDDPTVAARFEPRLSEFILPYDEVREARSPRETLLGFLESTYAAGATRAGWDRRSLER